MEYVLHSRLLCGTSENEVIYQSNLLNVEGRTASELIELVQSWVDTGAVIEVGGVRYVLDSYCQVGVTEVDSVEECVALNPTTATPRVGATVRPVHITAAIAGGVGGILGLIALVLLLAGLLLAFSRTGTYSLVFKKKPARLRYATYGETSYNGPS